MKRLSKILDSVHSVNSFVEAEEITLIRGNAETLYFRLFTEKASCSLFSDPCLRRYIPQGTTILVEVKFDHVDDEYVVRRVATNPYADDTSIWSVPLLATDRISFNSMEITLVEDGQESSFAVETDIATQEVGPSRRFC